MLILLSKLVAAVLTPVLLIAGSLPINIGSVFAADAPAAVTSVIGPPSELLIAKPKPKPDFDRDVLKPLKEKQEADRLAAEKALADLQAAQAAADAEAARIAAEQSQAVWRPSEAVSMRAPPAWSGLMGSIGWATAGGNCVNEPGVNNPGYGNPSDWPATSQSPWIGATVLFYYNHTGVITGIWDNGDIEIRHQNFYGGQHRFSRSEFRGFR